MKENLKSIYYFLQKILRKDVKLLQKMRRENLVTVLNLHQVSPHNNPFWSPLKPEIFDDLLSFLKENFEVTLFSEIDKVKSEKPLAILSFDDGYYNFVEYAVPILEKYGLRANMNIIPSCAESGEPMWNIKLYDFLNSAPKKLIDEIRFAEFDHRLKDESFGSKVQYGLKISRFLKNRPRRERLELYGEIEKLMKKCDFQLTRMLNAEEIKQIARNHEIGVHSFSHESMEFEETSFFEEDLQKCQNYFSEKLQIPLEIYAFPNGSYRKEQIKILQDKNIKHVLLVGEDYAKKKEKVFPRFTIYGSSRLETRFQSLGFNKKS
jgi:peptidoglycan/xylan/chitin deacetylase (PgdA/CDA1 family)